MGIVVAVYRCAKYGDSSNGGVSAKHDSFTVVNVDGPFEPTDQAPAALLLKGPGPGPNPILCPAQLIEGKWVPEARPSIGPMSGGNYAGATDSRWCSALKALGGLDLARIHDRFDTPELHDRLTS
jgi:hypothetical protein